MRYLLDVNALVALGFRAHEFHRRVSNWFSSGVRCSTCSVTELGFVRVLAQVPQYQLSIDDARTLLSELRRVSGARLSFLADKNDVTYLPLWVKTPGQITDGHLSQLAASNGMTLATLDEKILNAFLIPDRIK